jgi:predicted transcriptional regulator
MSEQITLNKLIILYMLNEVDFPMTTSQISEFMLEQEYTNFFKLKESLDEMVETGLLQTEDTHHRTLYILTTEGAKAGEYFGNKISPAIQEDIELFLREKKYDLKEESGIKSNYFFDEENGEYHVRCRIVENSNNLMDLKLIVPTEKEAQAIVSAWLGKYEKVYSGILEELL